MRFVLSRVDRNLPMDPATQGCRDDSQRGVGGSGGELVRSDPTGRRYVHDGVKVSWWGVHLNLPVA